MDDFLFDISTLPDTFLHCFFSLLNKIDTRNLCLTSAGFNDMMNRREIWKYINQVKIDSSISKKTNRFKLPIVDINWRRIYYIKCKLPELFYEGVEKNCLDMIKLSIEMKFSIATKNYEVLKLSIKKNNVEITKIFIDYMTEQQIKDTFTCDFITGNVISNDLIDILELLMSYPYINQVIRFGRPETKNPEHNSATNTLIQYSCSYVKPKTLKYLLDTLDQSSVSLFSYLFLFVDKKNVGECIDIIISHKHFNLKSIPEISVRDLILRHLTPNGRYDTLNKIMSIDGIFIGDPTIYIDRMIQKNSSKYIHLFLTHPTTDRSKIKTVNIINNANCINIEYIIKMLDYNDISFTGCKMGKSILYMREDRIHKILSNKDINLNINEIFDHIISTNARFVDSYNLIKGDPRSNSYDPTHALNECKLTLSIEVLSFIEGFPLFHKCANITTIKNMMETGNLGIVFGLIGHSNFPRNIEHTNLDRPMIYCGFIILSYEVVNQKLRLSGYHPYNMKHITLEPYREMMAE